MKNIRDVRLFLLVTVFLFFVIEITGLAEEIVSKKPYHVPAITSTIKIDGILEEKAWEDALVMELDNEIIPEKNMNIKPAVKTEVLLVYDADHFYAAFRAYDPDPTKIRAIHTHRDSIYKDDHVGLNLEFSKDDPGIYCLICNPKGAHSGEIASPNKYIPWDGTWKSAGKINSKGYVVEMAIPFSILPLKGKKEQVWAINAVRIYIRKAEHIIGLFPRYAEDKCYMCKAPKIVIFKGQ